MAPSARGYTLAELVVVIVLIAIVALAAIPVLRSQSPTKLDAAAAEVGDVLRFTVSEANRTGGFLLVDLSAQGRLRVLNSNASGAMLAAVNDPLTKSALQIDTSAAPWSGAITMTANFQQSGAAYNQLLVGPAVQLQVFDSGINRGPLQSGSGITLNLGSASAVVAIDETTGRISIP